MGFHHFKINNFRNLKKINIDVNHEAIFCIGENGQGKTNFIESIYLLCFGSSFRTSINQNLINDPEIPTYLSGKYYNKKNDSFFIEIIIYNKKKEIRINSKKITDRKELIGIIPCILFSHEDMIFVKGPTERRRWFFDQTISLIEPNFINLLRNYNTILKNRNLSLKNREYELISIYDDQLIAIGLEIILKRKNIVEIYNHVFISLFSKISELENQVYIKYTPSWKSDNKEVIKNNLKKRLNFDLRLKTTTSGPHRDRYHYIWKNKNFTDIASTGQIRLSSLVARLSQAYMLLQFKQINPVLLLDDVLLELDKRRQKNFFQNLCQFDQAFFTFLPDFSLDLALDHKLSKFFIDNGCIQHETS